MRAYLLTMAAALAVGCGGGVKGRDSTRGSTASAQSAQAQSTAADTGIARTAGTTAGAAAPGTAPLPATPARGGEKPSGSRAQHATGVAGGDTVVRSDAADTARGIVAVVGTSFDSRVILRQPGGGRSVMLLGPEARTVGRMSGADVWVSGTRDEAGRITVSRFAIRTVDGQPALDGTLIARGDRLLLVTRDGKQHPIENPPPALRQHVGARVWITGSLERGPVTFGVIEERR